MEKIINLIPCPACLLIVSGLAFVMGMYVSSQIRGHIRRNIFNNNLKNHEDEQKKRKN